MEYQLYNLEFPQEKDIKLTAVERVLTNRGIPLEDVEHYLNTTDNDIINPLELANIREGAVMLIRHIEQRDNVLIQIDSDCDGYTSAAVLINYLNCLFPAFAQSNIYYRVHTGKQHGLIPETVPEDVKLVILPDSSSNDYEEHKVMKKRGIDVLVIDHHEAEKISPDACVINNQLCDYPNKTLSGVGVVYKFCSYIDSLLGTKHADKYLDLVALGIIGDVMDLRNFETKHLVNKGLQQIQNPYFKSMVAKAEFKIGKSITADGVAFYVAPFVNAVTRVGSQEEKLTLFESMLDHRAYEQVPSTKRGCKGQTETRVEQACRSCANIKNRQTKARDESLNKIEQTIEENQLLKNKLLVIPLNTGEVNKNLTGLIANILMSKYQKPVMLLNKTEHMYEGSARGSNQSKFNNFKEFVNNSGYANYAEGHAQAFGAGIPQCRLDDFIECANIELADFDFSPYYKVDCIYDFDTVDGSFVLDVANMKSLWGQGVPEPFIAIENVKISKDNITLMSKDKNPTLKITLPNGGSLIKFRSSNEEYENLYSELGCVTINVVGKCERNEWNGKIHPQIIIEDYEIVGRTAYYF